MKHNDRKEQDGKKNELTPSWLPKNCDPENITVTSETLVRVDENRKGVRIRAAAVKAYWGADGGRGGWVGSGDVCCSCGCGGQGVKELPGED